MNNFQIGTHGSYVTDTVAQLKAASPSLKVKAVSIGTSGNNELSQIWLGENRDTSLLFAVEACSRTLLDANHRLVALPENVYRARDILAYAVKVQKVINRSDRAMSRLNA